MKQETIHQIVADKNKELERHAIRSAEHIIEQIADCQSEIEHAQKRITELRKELHELEIKQLDVKQVLGE
jgi:hypothetical protein